MTRHTVSLALCIAIAPGLGAFAAGRALAVAPPATTKFAPHEVSGIIRSLNGSQFTLQLRNGRFVRVDAAAAMQGHQSAVLVVSRPFLVRGSYDATGVLHAQTILRAKGSQQLWETDR